MMPVAGSSLRRLLTFTLMDFPGPRAINQFCELFYSCFPRMVFVNHIGPGQFLSVQTHYAGGRCLFMNSNNISAGGFEMVKPVCLYYK